jgi:hypothetical protein
VRSGKDGHGNILREPESNTLPDTQTMRTTISVLYEAAKKLLQAHDIHPQLRPGSDKLEEFYEEGSGVLGHGPGATSSPQVAGRERPAR